MKKLTTSDDGQRVITIVHLSLRLRCPYKTEVLPGIRTRGQIITSLAKVWNI